MESREFVIRVRRPWTLWILPVIALLYFVAIVVLAVMNQLPAGRDGQILVLAGAALFALVFLVQLPFLMRRRRARPVREEPVQEDAWTPAEAPLPPVEPVAPAPVMAASADDETLTTAETQKGFRVLEYSRPAKSANKGSVYTKTYVPVTKEHVLRVETLVAERHEV